MPFIHIKSLPFQKDIDTSEVIIRIGKDFARHNQIPLEHVHTTWEFFKPGHFAKGDLTPEFQPQEPHSLIVDLMTPDFNDSQTIRQMLLSLADSIARHARVPKSKIFINHRQAHSGMVYDDGKIVSW